MKVSFKKSVMSSLAISHVRMALLSNVLETVSDSVIRDDDSGRDISRTLDNNAILTRLIA
jgi:hypothetical protein